MTSPGGRIRRSPVVAVGACSSRWRSSLAGTPARGASSPRPPSLDRVPHDVDPATFPSITVDQDVLDWNHEISGAGAREIVLTLAENLELENQALAARGRVDPRSRRPRRPARRDARPARDRGDAAARPSSSSYEIDDVHVTLIVPFGRQDGLSLGLRSQRHGDAETLDADGHVQARTIVAVRHDVRPAPGHRRTVAQRRRAAARPHSAPGDHGRGAVSPRTIVTALIGARPSSTARRVPSGHCTRTSAPVGRADAAVQPAELAADVARRRR